MNTINKKLLENIAGYNIILASNSPRRKELLTRLGLNFKVRTLMGVDESYPAELKGAEVVEYISRTKARAYKSSMADDEIVITADTAVCVDDKVLGKPKDATEAKATLQLLSGRTHTVVTGVTILSTKKRDTFSVLSKVKFAQLLPEEIDYYVDNYLPFDKAGSYGIQDWIGLVAVEDIQGSFFNVMGLPVQRLYSHLKAF